MSNPSQNLPEILPKSFQNPSKILPKIHQNRSKIGSQIDTGSQTRSKTIPNASFSIFYWFFEPPGPPKFEPKSRKIEKKRWKIDVKKTHGFQHHFFSIFHGFGLRKRLQNRGFFALFSKTSILWKLAKTIEKTMVFIDFSGSEPPKIHPKSMPKRNPKKHRKKTSQKSILASVLASQNLPKSTQHRKKTTNIASRKKLKKNKLGPHRKPPEIKRRQAF